MILVEDKNISKKIEDEIYNNGKIKTSNLEIVRSDIITREMMMQLDTINANIKYHPTDTYGIDGLDSAGKNTILNKMLPHILTKVNKLKVDMGDEFDDDDELISLKQVSFPRYETIWGRQIHHNLHSIEPKDRNNIEHSRLYIHDRIDYFNANTNSFNKPSKLRLIITDRTPISNLVCNLHLFKSVAAKNRYINDALTEICTYGYKKIFILCRLTAEGAVKHREYMGIDKSSRVIDKNESEKNQVQFNNNIKTLMDIKELSPYCEFIDIGSSSEIAFYIASCINKQSVNVERFFKDDMVIR